MPEGAPPISCSALLKAVTSCSEVSWLKLEMRKIAMRPSRCTVTVGSTIWARLTARVRGPAVPEREMAIATLLPAGPRKRCTTCSRVSVAVGVPSMPTILSLALMPARSAGPPASTETMRTSLSSASRVTPMPSKPLRSARWSRAVSGEE